MGNEYADGVPTVQDAEREATRLLNGWWKNTQQDAPLPVDPAELARQLGIFVTTAHLPTAESGKIEFMGDDTRITINNRDHPNRQRFTCAHEIGHYLRRRDGAGNWTGFVDYRDTLAGMGVDTEEIFANQFAAALLMPAHLVRRWHAEQLSATAIAKRLGTSEQALNLRLRNLRLA